jgi:branched-subunit amino acid aminotransferase/4-amino-4-deoxychorismate lyase
LYRIKLHLGGDAMSFEKTKWVWHNGQNIPFDQATIHSTAFGLHYGTGVFEGIRAYDTQNGPAIFRLKEHLDRLYASAQVYDLDIAYTPEQLTQAICDNIMANDFTNCYIRPTAFFDAGGLGKHSDLGMAERFRRQTTRRHAPDAFALAQVSSDDDADDGQGDRAILKLYSRRARSRTAWL